MRTRVVVTGAGVVSPIGAGRVELWDALERGTSGARRVDLEGVGEINAFPTEAVGAEERFGRREVRRMDRAGALGAVAAALALEDAGELGVEPDRIGVASGSAHGGADTIHEAYRTFFARGADRISPFAIPLGLTNTAASAVARVHRLRGPSAAVTTACAAGSDAIGIALGLIRDGRADAMVAGGAEAAVSPFVIAGYRKLGALSTADVPPLEASRPFDRARDGFVMGEGAGFLVIEERERAIRRGARILAELAGYGTSCDADHLTDPDPTGAGAALAIRRAIADAGLAAADIGYVNAHATSTPAGDIAEAHAIAAAGVGGAAVSSTKALHGHMLGAAGGVEAVALLMVFARDLLPPTANLHDPEPEPALDHVTELRPARVGAALSNSFGFGGHNAALVFTRHEEDG